MAVTATSLRRVQRALDEKAYPPTHNYDVATMTPRGVLAERVALVELLCPTFFAARRFLDVGASKGYFSLRVASHPENDEVIAVDIDAAALRAWASVCPPNLTQVVSRFKTWAEIDNAQYDRIWVGNGHHYLQRDDPHWLRQLLRLASADVLIEGPIGKRTPDFESWVPGSVPEESVWLLEAYGLGFQLMDRAVSPPYTPGRAIWYLRKMR